MIKKKRICKTNVSKKKTTVKVFKKILLSVFLLKFSTSCEVGKILLNERNILRNSKTVQKLIQNF